MKKLFIMLILGIFIFSCRNSNSNNSTENNTTKETQNETKSKEILVTSIPPLKWLVQNIAGNEFSVISIIQPNMNHELFEPKPNDLKDLENSKLFFTYNALNFETKISDTISDKAKIVNLIENIDKSLLLEEDDDHSHNHSHNKKGHSHNHKYDHNHDHDHSEFDPHLWFSVELMPKFAETIKNRLIEVYPDKKDTFEENYHKFLEELAIFRKETDTKMSTKTKKYFMIYHPVFSYFLKDYNIKEVAVEYQGKEPSAKQIKEIIEEAKEHNITTIFVQPQFPKQSIEVISKEISNVKIIEFNADEENVIENLKKFVDSLE